ncbi:NlpC/P60 family protein [Actinopolymorpha sp. NPDC004070]|uniref:C40 family peptidase n=1 Tax=Actinopolymorpha sp. NPDC004070 TaxID=3154548 RepID=UPI0033ACC378
MTTRRARSGRALFVVGTTTATLAALVALPGSSYAEPSTRSIGEVRQQVDELYAKAEKVTEQANELGDKMTAINRRVRSLDADVTRQQQRVSALRGDIGQFAAAQYRAGNVDMTAQLAVSKDPNEYLARMRTVKVVDAQQGDMLRQLQEGQKRLAEQRAARSAELASYREAKSQADARRKTALRNVAEAKALLERLTAEQKRRIAAAEKAAREKAAREQAAREQAQSRSTRSTGGGRTTPKSDLPSNPGPAPAPKPAPAPSGSGRGATALAFARAQLGEPYVFGAAGPNSWDCSGLTMGAWRAAGVSLPHSSRSQYAISTKISKSQLRPGDLVLFYSDRHHVGIYAGNGMVIHAPRPGKTVEYIKMAYMPYAGAVRPG